MDIRYLKREEIDKVKWNSCVHYANNGNIFGYMWYLDFIAKDWDALVEGDYESVFPLPWKEDFLKRKELVQPALMRELGIYSIHVLSQPRMQAFLDAIPDNFQYVNLAMNEQNQLSGLSGFQLDPKDNHQLLLSRPYEELFDNFSTEMAGHLQRAEDEGIILTSSLKPETLAEFWKANTPSASNKEELFHGMQRVMYNVLHRGWGFASAAMNSEQEIYAVNFFIYSHNKVISFAPAQSARGKALGALPYLFNALIRSHAGRPLLLDFNSEGSDELPQAFGAQPNSFYRLKRNSRVFGIF